MAAANEEEKISSCEENPLRISNPPSDREPTNSKNEQKSRGQATKNEPRPQRSRENGTSSRTASSTWSSCSSRTPASSPAFQHADTTSDFKQATRARARAPMANGDRERNRKKRDGYFGSEQVQSPRNAVDESISLPDDT